MRKKWVFLIFAAGAIAVLVVFFFDRDGRRIEKRLDRLVETVEKERGEGPLVTLAKSRRIASFFTPESRLRLQPIVRPPLSYGELPQLLLQAHGGVETLSIRILYRRLELDRRVGVAEMQLTAEAILVARGSEDVRVHEFVIGWVRQENEWYIDRAEIVEGTRHRSYPARPTPSNR